MKEFDKTGSPSSGRLRGSPVTAPLADNRRRIQGVELSRRDLTLLRLLAAGYNNRQIATELTLAESTVKNNLSALFHKIGVRDRTQAVLYAFSRGLVPDSMVG